MQFRPLVQSLCQRPGMYVNPATFGSVCAYLAGFDAARDGGPLCGFREWLIVRANRGNNLVWEGLADLILQEESTSTEAERIRGLGQLIEEYLQYREENGLEKVYHDYARWLLRHRWYHGPLRRQPEGSAGSSAQEENHNETP